MSESFLLSLPFGSVIGSIIIFVLGLSAAYYWFDKDRRNRRKDENDAEDRLIKLLKQTADEWELKFQLQEKKIIELTKKVDELERENGTLIEILQGRDEQTKKFYEQAFESMKISKESHAILVQLAETKKDTNDNIKRLIDLLMKNTDVIGQSIKNH